MSAFVPGQLVRIVRIEDPSDTPGVNVGDEGIVTEVDHGTLDEVPVTLYGLDICPLWEDDEFTYGFLAHELAPVIPPDEAFRDEVKALNEPEPIEALENAAMRRENHSFLSTLAEAAWMADTGAMP